MQQGIKFVESARQARREAKTGKVDSNTGEAVAHVLNDAIPEQPLVGTPWRKRTGSPDPAVN